MLTAPLLSANLGVAVSQVAARVRAGVVEVHSRGGSGSGTVWTSDGVVITNHHVVARDEARVTLEDGRSFSAAVFARDPRNDLAALRIDADTHDLPTVTR